jgi:hypothetical protein
MLAYKANRSPVKTGSVSTGSVASSDDILDALYWLDTNDHSDAAWLADEAIASVIHALRRDPRMPKLNQLEWELLLADARAEIEQDISDVVDGTIDYDKVEDAVKEACGDDGEGDDE